MNGVVDLPPVGIQFWPIGDTMSTILALGTVKRLLAVSIAVAVVLGAGLIVGGAPTLFEDEIVDEPEPSLEFPDQTGDGTSVTVENVSLSHGGFVAVSDGSGEIVGVSEHLEAGEHGSVTVEQREGDDLEMLGRLTATAHRETTDDGEFAYEETDGEEDRPYLEAEYPVSESATVTVEETPTDGADTSFLVESVDVPEDVATDAQVTVTAEIRNPNEFETRQHVEIRADGTVLERRVVELGAGESRDLEFELAGDVLTPGESVLGVYTVEDGVVVQLDVEYAGDPELTVVDVEEGSMTVDAALQVTGFVGVENATGELVGTSERLDAGVHEEVPVGFEPEPGNLTVVLFEGDTDEPEEATPATLDGEPVATTVATEE